MSPKSTNTTAINCHTSGCQTSLFVQHQRSLCNTADMRWQKVNCFPNLGQICCGANYNLAFQRWPSPDYSHETCLFLPVADCSAETMATNKSAVHWGRNSAQVVWQVRHLLVFTPSLPSGKSHLWSLLMCLFPKPVRTPGGWFAQKSAQKYLVVPLQICVPKIPVMINTLGKSDKINNKFKIITNTTDINWVIIPPFIIMFLLVSWFSRPPIGVDWFTHQKHILAQKNHQIPPGFRTLSATTMAPSFKRPSSWTKQVGGVDQQMG